MKGFGEEPFFRRSLNGGSCGVATDERIRAGRQRRNSRNHTLKVLPCREDRGGMPL